MGNLIWQTEYDIYGKIRNLKGDRNFIPFRQLGQYEDVETGLYYNRFRYYDSFTGLYISKDPIGLLGGFALYGYVRDSNKYTDIFGLLGTPISSLIDGVSLPDSAKVFRISESLGIDGFKFNSRELAAIESGKLNPAGISLIRADSIDEAMKIWNNAFPERPVDLTSIKGTTAKEIRAVGFDVIHNPTKGKIGNVHARLIHPDGVSGFSDENLTKLVKKIECS